MCNLYSQTRARESILRLFRVSDNRAAAVAPQSAIFPGYTAPVVRGAADGARELVSMSWGFVFKPKDGKAWRRVTNVRDDKLTSPFWRPSFEARRCLVPASSYCEPDAGKPAAWHWFALQGEEDRQLFAFPGIWQHWSGLLKRDGAPVETDLFAFLTTEPNDLTRAINHERMPVLLSTEDQFEAWLSGSPAEVASLAKSFDPARMRIVQSGQTKEDLLDL